MMFYKDLHSLICKAFDKTELPHAVKGTYVCIEGPQFSSRAESHMYRQLGATVIGMTNVPESYLAKEAGMAYATIAMVTDYDCWKEEHCTVDEIMKVMQWNNEKVQVALKELLPMLNQEKFPVKTENQFAIMTPKESMSADQKDLVEVLLS